MAPNQPAESVDTQASAEVALINDRELIERFAEMAVMIPADNSGGTEDILRKILSAETWGQLDEPWQATQVDDILGKTLHITKVTRRPSTMAGGLGQFLVIHLQDAKTGKEYVKTTGSIAVVGQIARAYALGVTALTVEWCKAERPSASGFYPQHLRVIDAATSDAATAKH
jgi:hypothetical protein